MSTTFRVFSYLNYWLDAVDEHSLHSPFFFDFYTNILRNRSGEKPIASIETLRDKLLADSRVLKTNDPGAGAGRPARTIGEITQTSIAPSEKSMMYNRIIRHIKAKTIVELGTSFGINSLYLANGTERTVYTFEGSAEVANIARITFEFGGAKNIQLIEGNLDVTLSDFLPTLRRIDFALIDANHRYEPTVRYFGEILERIRETAVVVVDDINYSPQMKRAWKTIREHELVHGSADLYDFGILFFDPSLNKQHVILQS